MSSPQIASAARRYQAARQQAAAVPPPIFFADVATVAAGQARDGNAAVTVTWRTSTFNVNGYGAWYTPVVGDRVLCAYDGRQVVIMGNLVGWQ